MLDLFDNGDTMGLPVIQCEYNLPGCGAWTVPINYNWNGYTPNEPTIPDDDPGAVNQTTITTATGQTTNNTPPLGQPPTAQPAQIIAGVDNKTLLLIGAAVGLIALTR